MVMKVNEIKNCYFDKTLARLTIKIEDLLLKERKIEGN